ncbi:MAG: hypothetical protein ACOX2L_10400 [Anaerolineae bacterium]|jgi:2,4-dienoyl-CoA reductase-like NADH-dependent reductase (Old Yellow Enzyme family)|nr:NADH:flavin oxidoreductase [Chloroflexota bacterium]
MTDRELLFEPLHVGPVTLRNRIVMPPMVVNRGVGTPESCQWYGARARGGVGLVIVEATSVSGFTTRHTLESLSLLAGAIHAGGAMAALQLFPGTRGQRLAPADLSREDIDGLLADYAAAARLCASAGFDGVEIHGAHGYLLNQFFSPVQNARSDAFGGTLAGRMLLGTRIVREVRGALPAERLLLYRHTPAGPSYGIEESLQLAETLVDAGVDILDLSPSSLRLPGDAAAPFRSVGVPVITVNGLDEVARATEALREGRADLVAIGRGLIADSDWPNKVRAGQDATLVRCIQCDMCHEDLAQGRVVRCSQWS